MLTGSSLASFASSSQLKQTNVWTRSCEQEIVEPLEGVVKGNIPTWINGSLLRNGAGSLKVGDKSFKHFFDAAALIHRFNITEGKVTYQCRFLQTNTYKTNQASNRISVTEFGTSSMPDPCESIFKRISSVFKFTETSDNALISIYPINDEYYALTEFPVLHKIDPTTLETKENIKLSKYFRTVMSNSAHPHVMSDGTAYNVILALYATGPHYTIVRFPQVSKENVFKKAEIVAKIPTRWAFHPSYMHTFGITSNYFIIIEQPLTISVPLVMKAKFKNSPLASCFKWFPKAKTYFYLIDRRTGKLSHKFKSDPFCFFHIINQYEKDNSVVVDVCTSPDHSTLEKMYIESLEQVTNEAETYKRILTTPVRFVLPLSKTYLRRVGKNISKIQENDEPRLDDKASAMLMYDGSVFCRPELLTESKCELPAINYSEYLGKDYQFFYSISTNREISASLVKVDVNNKTHVSWHENNCFPSEPVFVPSPNPQSEDDGVVLASLVYGESEDNRISLLVLDARTFKELGRCEFNDLPSPVPKCFHGWFAKNV